YEGVLAVWPVSTAGEPLGPPRRITTESAHAPSWAGDSRHILYQSIDKLRIIDVETGEVRTVPLDLKYTPAIPKGRIIVHAGKLVYGTGYLMEWQRVYYKMGIAISSVAQFEMELQRAKVLQHDLIKSYVRLPDLQQKRMVEFAHSIGVPVATHEIYPAAFVGV